jgi:hypothetical protein
MSTLADLLVLNLGARFTKLLVESWFGKGAGTTIVGDVVDVFKGRIQSTADQKKAKRELEELGDRMARELLPLFEDAERLGHVNVEAVALALDSALAGLKSSRPLVQKDLEPGAILGELKQTRPLPSAQFSQAETDLYERALERSVRQLVEIASRLPQFEETVAARSLQQLSRVATNIDEILAGIRNIEKTVGAEALDKKAREYEIDYRLAVQRNLDYLEIFGIDLPPEARSHKLSVAYISLNLESRSRERSESLTAEALFDRLGNEGYLLIRGDAGTGKSTLLRWAAIQAATGHPQVESWALEERMETAASASWRTRVPFLIRLRQCKAGSLPGPDDFPEHITQAVGSPPADWVRSVLKEGRALLLLDGVDEIPNAHREATRRGIADLVAQYPKTCFVVSTRPRAVDPDWLGRLGFREARINPLSDLDRARFIDRWHDAVARELQEQGKDAKDLESLAHSLKKQLADNSEVSRLANNPLLCAMICALHRDRRQKLPERQRQLCEDLCHALLHRRERESGLNLEDFPEPYRRLDYLQKRAAVQELAHHMVLNEYSSLPVEEAREQIGKALRQFPGHSAADAPIVTDSLVERSGILREENTGEISFIHNSLKEMLAGDYFADADSAGLLANHVFDSTWHPVILFAVAADRRGFANKVIKKILEPASDLRARQLMALRCRAATLYIDEELDRRLQKLTTTLFPPQNMEDAEALATGGNTAVPFLLHRENLKAHEAAASLRALRLIGTPHARQAIRSFLGDRRETVISELAQAVNPLEINWVRRRLSNGDRVPAGIAAQISDLALLAEFNTLRRLHLSGTQVEDLSTLASFSKLDSLYLRRTAVEDLSPLTTLSKLQHLDLRGTRVIDLSPLAGLHNLQHLDLRQTVVADLSPLARLRKLQSLFLNETLVEDLSPLEGLDNLRSLYLAGTLVVDLSPLEGLDNLRSLYLAGTLVVDLSPLSRLKNLQDLDVRGTGITDFSSLAGLNHLQLL